MKERAAFCGMLFIHLKIPEAVSLKDRRQVTRSILEKARNRFNVSVADPVLMASARRPPAFSALILHARRKKGSIR